ncbi:uncharacterized protein M421DRAFT_421892 [Didymella exigua CBS 183.55]|uniref:Uncharacterized protein n=1 Tax=Didymella exigua CBS 183.55 TaxID=1150837 RepID=A0A6A5RGP8_9PLEO|nr:uncharacterized protein M421DRAFT_421892 [Didymella exigua CBS 183.55]KAF1927485.1 hypothetical protein M421DRAFT_421892 [Didymella exigua CBS 183.55]
MEGPADDAAKDAFTAAKPSRFHFKSSSSRRKRRHDAEDQDASHRSSKHRHSDDESSSRRAHRSARRKHRHDHSDRHPTSTADGSYYDPDSRHRESLFDQADSNDADVFRESLFDALADDEGAAYWEGVYGQPIHVYPTEKRGPDGKLERMTEDEYADFVRTKMWEKTHQHIVEERDARERARRKRKEEQRHWDEEGERDEMEREGIRRQMEESLRRGEERKRAKEAAKSWEVYAAKWEKLGQDDGATEGADVKEMIPWPVLSGQAKHVGKQEIERFLRASPAWKDDASALLKAERVRWHPDKMQRRFGTRIDEDTIRDVTAVFQVIDQMWNARR